MKENIDKQFDYFTDDFLSEKAVRTIVIIGSSKIDDLLSSMISKYLLPKISRNNDQDELLEGDRPLATLSSRIKMAYRLGFVDKSLYRVLEKVRIIRNSSAHEIEFNINKSPVKEHYANLVQELKKRESFKLIAERYFSGTSKDKNAEMKCAYLTICMLLELLCSKIQMIKQNKKLLSISQK